MRDPRPDSTNTSTPPRRHQTMSRLLAVLGVVLAGVAGPAPARAQVLGVRAGITNYDLVGTGTEPMVSVSRSWRLDRRFYLAASLPTFFAVRSASVGGFSVPDNIALLLPELTVGLRPLVRAGAAVCGNRRRLGSETQRAAGGRPHAPRDGRRGVQGSA